MHAHPDRFTSLASRRSRHGDRCPGRWGPGGSRYPAGTGRSDDCTGHPDSGSGVPQFQTADQLLAFIDQNYDQGAGGGQLSNLIKSVMKLRAQGIKPSRANIAEIQNALQYRPNQKPLIDALQDTLSYQNRIFAQMQILQQAQQRQQNNAVMGAGQMPSDGAPTIGGNTAPVMPAPASP